MKRLFSDFCTYTVLGVTLLGMPSAYAVQSRDTSFNKAVAIYEYMRGDQQQAILELATEAGAVLPSSETRNRKLLRLEQLQQTFERNLAGEMPDSLNNSLWLDISALHYSAGDCQAALDALEEVRNVSARRDHEERLLRVSCMLDQHNLTQGVLIAAENLAQTAEGESISLAYLYNNIAAAAQYMEDYDAAQRYFLKAMEYVGDSDEGRALFTRIRLSLAWSYYESRRYDFSLNEFAKLRIDNEWVDVSLLGYGWAAFKNSQPGLAIEAWRQLVYLPFKSIGVYEGYLAIPYALESQNAYAEALTAYKAASSRYAEQIAKVEELSKSITARDIEQHAVDYARSNGESITPLHPLLVEAFSRGDFQDVFDVIADVDAYHLRLESYETTVAVLDEARKYTLSNQSSGIKGRTQSEADVEKRLKQLLANLDDLAGKILTAGMNANYVSDDLKAKYQRYLLLQKSVAQSGKQASMQESLARVRNILIGELEEVARESGKTSLISDSKVTRLADSYRLSEQRYRSYWAMKPYANKVNVGESELQSMQQRIESAKAHIVALKAKIDQLLLIKTRDALDEQKQQLVIYENQARIALVRLSEEFYQRGGRKLWR